MMSEPSKIDRETVDELTGKLVLLIEESRPWSGTASMHQQLSAKVRHYVRYIRSSDFAKNHAERPQDTIVRLMCNESPPQDSREFLGRIGYELQKHGIDFEYQVGEEGVPIAAMPGAAVAATRPESTPAAEPPSEAPPAVSAVPDATDVAEPEEAISAAVTEDVAPVAESPVAAEMTEAEPFAEAEEAEDVVETEAAAAIERTLDAPETGEVSELGEPSDVAEVAAEPVVADHVTPEAEGRDLTPPSATPEQLEKELQPEPDWEPEFLGEGPSELELLVEASDEEASRFIGLEDEPSAAEPDDLLQQDNLLPDAEQSRPEFFPEEEFGRALTEFEHVDHILSGADSGAMGPAVIETSSGDMILLDVSDAAADERARAHREGRPSIRRAVGAAIGAAVAGALIWAVLAIPAGQGASLLAVAVALMVGMSVRLRGAGQAGSFRFVACLGTIFGSLLGTLLGTAALLGWGEGQGPEEVVAMFSNPDRLRAALETHVDPLLALASLAIALYIAFRISAAGPTE
jgi:hypothetical protein